MKTLANPMAFDSREEYQDAIISYDVERLIQLKEKLCKSVDRLINVLQEEKNNQLLSSFTIWDDTAATLRCSDGVVNRIRDWHRQFDHRTLEESANLISGTVRMVTHNEAIQRIQNEKI